MCTENYNYMYSYRAGPGGQATAQGPSLLPGPYARALWPSPHLVPAPLLLLAVAAAAGRRRRGAGACRAARHGCSCQGEVCRGRPIPRAQLHHAPLVGGALVRALHTWPPPRHSPETSSASGASRPAGHGRARPPPLAGAKASPGGHPTPPTPAQRSTLPPEQPASCCPSQWRSQHSQFSLMAQHNMAQPVSLCSLWEPQNRRPSLGGRGGRGVGGVGGGGGPRRNQPSAEGPPLSPTQLAIPAQPATPKAASRPPPLL
jgi:hypothetical protein